MANDIYQLTIVEDTDGEFFESVIHFEKTAPVSTNPAQSAKHLIAAFKVLLESNMLNLQGANVNLRGYKSKRVNNSGGPTYMQPETGLLGGDSNDCDVPSLAYVMTSFYVSGLTTRAGRWFIGGVPTGAYVDGSWNAGHVTAAATLAANLATTITNTGESFNFGVYSRSGGIFMTPSLIQLSPHLGTQRRRLLPVL